jgi:hypothetical protein
LLPTGNLEKWMLQSRRKLLCYRCYERQRTEPKLRDSYSDLEILETINMSITPRCNYAGTPGRVIPTRSFAFLTARVGGVLLGWLRRA